VGVHALVVEVLQDVQQLAVQPRTRFSVRGEGQIGNLLSDLPST